MRSRLTGRTGAFEALDLGSNPSSAAKEDKHVRYVAPLLRDACRKTWLSNSLSSAMGCMMVGRKRKALNGIGYGPGFDPQTPHQVKIESSALRLYDRGLPLTRLKWGTDESPTSRKLKPTAGDGTALEKRRAAMP